MPHKGNKKAKMKATWLAIAAALTLTLPAPLLAEECAPGPEGNLCKAENGDEYAMYMVGRHAYLEGREVDELAEAYKWAWRSKEAGYRGGRMLLKMIYLEASAGGHNDYVEAYHWLTKAIAEDNGEYLASWRKRLEALMTPEQRNEVVSPASN